MVGLGTIINALGIVLGGLAGLFFGKLIPQRCQDSLSTVCGISVLFIGVGGAMEEMLTVEGTAVSSGRGMLITLCLALGALIGELINIEELFERFGGWLKIKTGNARDKGFVDGFVTASLTACIGAMAIVGALQGGVTALAQFIKPVMTDAALSNLSLIGSVLIFCVGVNLVFGKKVRVANLLPAVVLAAAVAFLSVSF